MTSVDIRPFEPSDIQAAAHLLADRHSAERLLLPFLSDRFEAPETTAKAIKALLGKPTAHGLVAVENGAVKGYLISSSLFSAVLGRSAWIHAAGHAAERSDLYHDLYTVMSAYWLERGCFDHYITISAANSAALEQWFSLSFGKQQAYGVKILSDPVPSGEIRADLEIRLARPEDRDRVYEMGANNVSYQTGAPVFAAVPPEYIDDVREGYVETLENPDEGTIWLAFKDNELLGYQVYAPTEPDITHMLAPEDGIDLPAAGTLAAARGLGVGTALTQHCFAHYHAEGYHYVLTDWRTTNLLSSRFWPKMGFVPSAYRLARSIDPRIAWGHAGR